MKDEINKIIQSISDFYKLDNALKYYLDRHKAQILLDYITNLQTIEREYSAVLSENAELRIQISAREEEYIKLQEENKKLKELCDKYEEEHSTKFNEWQKDINIIDELEKYINEEIEDYNKALNSKLLSESGKEKYEAEKVCFLDMLDKLNQLKGDNK